MTEQSVCNVQRRPKFCSSALQIRPAVQLKPLYSTRTECSGSKQPERNTNHPPPSNAGHFVIKHRTDNCTFRLALSRTAFFHEFHQLTEFYYSISSCVLCYLSAVFVFVVKLLSQRTNQIIIIIIIITTTTTTKIIYIITVITGT